MQDAQGEWVDTDIDGGRLAATILCAIIVITSIAVSSLISLITWIMATATLIPILTMAIIDYGRSRKVVVDAR